MHQGSRLGVSVSGWVGQPSRSSPNFAKENHTELTRGVGRERGFCPPASLQPWQDLVRRNITCIRSCREVSLLASSTSLQVSAETKTVQANAMGRSTLSFVSRPTGKHLENRPKLKEACLLSRKGQGCTTVDPVRGFEEVLNTL